MNLKSTNVRIFHKSSHLVLRKVLDVTASVAPKLASQLALQVFLTPRRFRRPKRESNMLWLGEKRMVGTTATWSWGEGPTVVLVHGWEGRGSQLAEFVPTLVEAGFRVVVFDAPGHGSSTERTSSLTGFADALEAVAVAYGPLHGIVAHSMGAAATMLAERRRLARGDVLATRQVLIGAPGSVDTFTRAFAETLNLTPAVRAGLIREIERKFDVRFAELEPAHLLQSSPAQHLIVHDESDTWVPMQEAEVLARVAHQGTLLRTRNLGHHRILKDPSVVHAVAQFLAKDMDALRTTTFGHCLDRELYERHRRAGVAA